MCRKTYKRIISVLMLLCMCALLLSGTVSRADSGSGSGNISISAEKVSREDGDTYEIEVEVYNGGKDVSGVLRVAVQNTYKCVYEVPISLAEKSTKTCTVRIPKQSVYDERETINIYLYTSTGVLLEEESFPNLFMTRDYVMPVGILSDNYRALTYMDLGGDEVYLIGEEYEIGLTQLSKDNLDSELSNIRYLVIDDYDISVLESQQVAAIQTWVRNGGMLIIGTGAAGDKTFSSFDDDFIGLTLRTSGSQSNHTQSPEEVDAATPGDAQNPAGGIGNIPDYLYYDTSYFFDPPLQMAALDFDISYQSSYSGIYGEVKMEGDGSILVTNHSLSDSDVSGSNNAYVFAETLYSDALDYSNYVLSSGDDYFYYYLAQRAFSMLEGKQNLRLNGLKVIIFIYVLMISPILYLVLKILKKREYIWLIVPAITLLFVGIVFIVGRGQRVSGQQVLSVTVAKADGTGTAKSYFSSYQADPGEWELKLNDRVEAAGPVFSDRYYYSNSFSGQNYKHRIVMGTDGMSVGYVPSGSFENAYFLAESENAAHGKIDYSGVDLYDPYNPSGTVTNNSGYDFPYMLVVDQDYFLIIKDVKNGETVNLAFANVETRGTLYDPDILLSRVGDFYDDEEFEKAKLGSALYIGLCEVYQADITLVMGVTKNYADLIKSDCNEASWGCLYETGKK